MKFILTLLTLVTLTSPAFAASTTVMKCAVENVHGYEGARVNVIQNAKGEVRANLIFGTTVSGTMYKAAQVDNKIVGAIRNKTQFTIEVALSNEAATNKYISGVKATLSAVFPDLRNANGIGSVVTVASDNFVCGKQIAPFSQ